MKFPFITRPEALMDHFTLYRHHRHLDGFALACFGQGKVVGS